MCDCRCWLHASCVIRQEIRWYVQYYVLNLHCVPSRPNGSARMTLHQERVDHTSRCPVCRHVWLSFPQAEFVAPRRKAITIWTARQVFQQHVCAYCSSGPHVLGVRLAVCCVTSRRCGSSCWQIVRPFSRFGCPSLTCGPIIHVFLCDCGLPHGLFGVSMVGPYCREIGVGELIARRQLEWPGEVGDCHTRAPSERNFDASRSRCL